MQKHEQRVSIVVSVALQYKQGFIELYLQGTVYNIFVAQPPLGGGGVALGYHVYQENTMEVYLLWCAGKLRMHIKFVFLLKGWLMPK